MRVLQAYLGDDCDGGSGYPNGTGESENCLDGCGYYSGDGSGDGDGWGFQNGSGRSVNDRPLSRRDGARGAGWRSGTG